MNILAIDIGTYSIKIVEIRPERKNFVLIEKNEIIIEDARPHYPHFNDLKEFQREIVANYILKKPHDIKIIFQIPNELLTTRYFEIPGTSKRKAEQIVPFQLDENLPYSLNQAHFGIRLIKKANGFSVISNIAQLNFFKDFFNFFETKNVTPSVLTSELSTIQAYIDHVKLNDNCCILDFGHKTTKAYFIQDRKIVANHTSHIAGEAINELISKNYQITIEDAIVYKHENVFLLTDPQLDEVRPEQREFGILMKILFQHFLLEFKRWEIGHRVKFGAPISKIYIMGGTSQINGIEHFLSFHTGLGVNTIEPIVSLKNDYTLNDRAFFMVKMMAIAERTPSSVINFLTGKFQISSISFISLHSAIFIWVRTTFIALIICLGLTVERFVYLLNNDKVLDAKISNTFTKNATLSSEIPKRNRSDFSKNPTNLLSALTKKNKFVTQEVSTILASNNINAMRPLVTLSRIITNNPKISLIKFKSENSFVTAIFSSTELSEIQLMEKHLKNSGLSNLNSKLNRDINELEITFNDRD